MSCNWHQPLFFLLVGALSNGVYLKCNVLYSSQVTSSPLDETDIFEKNILNALLRSQDLKIT